MRLFYSAYFRLVCVLLVPGLLAAQPQSTLVVAGLDGGSGQSCSYSILPNGTLWAWGANGSGELGDGTFTTRPLPVPLMAPSQWRSLGAGLQHAAAVRADGTLWA